MGTSEALLIRLRLLVLYGDRKVIANDYGAPSSSRVSARFCIPPGRCRHHTMDVGDLGFSLREALATSFGIYKHRSAGKVVYIFACKFSSVRCTRSPHYTQRPQVEM